MSSKTPASGAPSSSRRPPGSSSRSGGDRQRRQPRPGQPRSGQPRPGAPSGKSRSRKPIDKVNKVYRNVHIRGDDPAIWSEHFRARTAPNTEILIGKNTVIGPGVNIIAEKGSIHIGDNNIISEGTLIINKSKEKLVIGDGNRFECGASLVLSSFCSD